MIDSIPRSTRVAIVGARGAVGAELAAILRGQGVEDVRLLSCSPGTAGLDLSTETLSDRDVVFLCTPSEVSRRWAPRALAAGALVVDNSSAFRLDPAVPLVIPEVNPEALSDSRLIANPNCSTILLLLVLAPLHRVFGVRRVSVATYQAVSGAGALAIAELREATAAALDGRPFEPTVFSEPVAFNCFSHDSVVDPATGSNGEEEKIVAESRRILAASGGEPPLLTATCIRVPVIRSHCEAVDVTLARPASLAALRRVLGAAPAVCLVDDRRRNRFPTSRSAEGGDEVLVGRLRLDRSRPIERVGGVLRGHGCQLFLAGDQLRRGAALNAVAIAAQWLARRSGAAG